MVPAVFGHRSDDSGSNLPRVNLVAIAILIVSVAAGVAGLMETAVPFRWPAW